VPECRAWVDRVYADLYALNFANAGRLRYGVGAAQRWLYAPVAWWTRPGQRYAYGAVSGESWDHYYVSLNGPRLARMEAGNLPPTSPRHVPDGDAFRQGFEKLLEELARRPAHNPRAVLQLEDLLLQLHELAEPPSSALEVAVRDLARRLREKPAIRLHLPTEAKRMGVSESHLRRCFRAATGLPPRRYRIRAGLDRAGELLSTTALPIKQIAARVGYEDVHHFTKLFKQRFRVTPGAYRREMRPTGNQ